MKKLDYASNDEEICLQIDKSLQTLSVDYEITSITSQQIDSLARQSLVINTSPTINSYQVNLIIIIFRCKIVIFSIKIQFGANILESRLIQGYKISYE